MTELQNRVIEIVADETCHGGLSLETGLDSLGIDSLEFVSLMQAIARAFWEIPDARWSSINTIDDLVKALEATK